MTVPGKSPPRGRISAASAIPVLVVILYAVSVLTLFPDPLFEAAKPLFRAVTGLEEKRVLAGRQWWSYLDGGAGDAVVMIHGYGSDKYRLALLARKFTRTHRVIVPDLPGFGESSQGTSQSYRVPIQAKRLRHFVTAIGLGRFHLVGNSMGGFVAAWYAAEYPDDVYRLVLMDAAGVRQPELSRAFRLYVDHGVNIFRYRNARELDRLVDLLFYRPPWIPYPAKRFAISRATERRRIREHILRELLADGDRLLESRLPGITAPALIIWGEKDRIIDVSAASVFQAALTRSRLEVIPDCGHVPFLEKPAETYRLTARFLKPESR